MMTKLSTPGGRTNNPQEKPSVFKIVLMIKRAMPLMNKSLSWNFIFIFTPIIFERGLQRAVCKVSSNITLGE
ncbi:hypothetical protein [uncultured Serratia sp.]|uniref:hypothetical protein n=1 Tax=uncultured Serratia sp. TaxID=239175 RepID=UPI00258604AC|nr:hypothetical protein [uncultured Serratia sp.]